MKEKKALEEVVKNIKKILEVTTKKKEVKK